MPSVNKGIINYGRIGGDATVSHDTIHVGGADSVNAKDSVLTSNHETPLFAQRQQAKPNAEYLASIPGSAITPRGRSPADTVSVEVAVALERKRAACLFDVFLCHNTADKPEVKRVGHKLKSCGILPWLDIWELPPGQPWQLLLEKQISSIKSAAVFVGPAGVGPWQEQEIYGFLREFVSRKSPVIPILLADAPQAPELPLFLRAMTWVDFRLQDPDPFEQLIWGITGKRPAHS